MEVPELTVPWTMECAAIESLCTATQDYTGYPSFAIHPYAGYSIPKEGYVLRLEAGTFISNRHETSDVVEHRMYDAIRAKSAQVKPKFVSQNMNCVIEPSTPPRSGRCYKPISRTEAR